MKLMWNSPSTATPLTTGTIGAMMSGLRDSTPLAKLPAAQWVVVAFAAENQARKLNGQRPLPWDRFTKLMLEQRDKLILGNVCFDAAMKYGR